MNNDFELVNRPYGDFWRHKTQEDYFIVFYESLQEKNKPCYGAYRAIEGCYQRDPWTVNNRCLKMFRTLEAAMAYADNS